MQVDNPDILEQLTHDEKEAIYQRELIKAQRFSKKALTEIAHVSKMSQYAEATKRVDVSAGGASGADKPSTLKYEWQHFGSFTWITDVLFEEFLTREVSKGEDAANPYLNRMCVSDAEMSIFSSDSVHERSRRDVDDLNREFEQNVAEEEALKLKGGDGLEDDDDTFSDGEGGGESDDEHEADRASGQGLSPNRDLDTEVSPSLAGDDVAMSDVGTVTSGGSGRSAGSG